MVVGLNLVNFRCIGLHLATTQLGGANCDNFVNFASKALITGGPKISRF
jgi:hypothetical protein